MNEIKIDWLNGFVWLVFIPCFSFSVWYGVYKFIQWII